MQSLNFVLVVVNVGSVEGLLCVVFFFGLRICEARRSVEFLFASVCWHYALLMSCLRNSSRVSDYDYVVGCVYVHGHVDYGGALLR